MPDEPVNLPVTVNPMTILDRLVTNGVEPDKLDRVIQLVESWNANRAKEAFSAAMNACQQEMPLVLHNDENTQTHKTYANLEAVNRIVKPCYTKHGFSIQFAEGEAKTEGEVRIVADVLHAGGHERRYFIDLPKDGRGAKGGQTSMNEIQGKGSTFSYGQRYLVKMIFNLTIAGEDTDGNGGKASINEDQTFILNELLETIYAARSSEEKYDKWIASFWKWLDCTDMNSLRASNFEKAKSELQRVIKDKAKEGKK